MHFYSDVVLVVRAKMLIFFSPLLPIILFSPPSKAFVTSYKECPQEQEHQHLLTAISISLLQRDGKKLLLVCTMIPITLVKNRFNTVRTFQIGQEK